MIADRSPEEWFARWLEMTDDELLDERAWLWDCAEIAERGGELHEFVRIALGWIRQIERLRAVARYERPDVDPRAFAVAFIGEVRADLILGHPTDGEQTYYAAVSTAERFKESR